RAGGVVVAVPDTLDLTGLDEPREGLLDVRGGDGDGRGSADLGGAPCAVPDGVEDRSGFLRVGVLAVIFGFAADPGRSELDTAGLLLRLGWLRAGVLLERCEVAFAAAHRLARSDQRGFGLRSRLVVDLVGERRRERPSLSVRPFGELVLGAELLQPDDTGVAASE